MDAALPVEEKPASVSAPDHTSSSSLDFPNVRQKVDSEKPGNGEVKIEVDEKDHQISHKEEPENEGMSPEERGIKEEEMASKHGNCAEERKESEDMAEEKNNTGQEEEEEEEKNISQVHSDLSLQLDKDKTLDENILDNEGKEDMEEMEETSEEKNKTEEMEHENSEQYREPKVMDVNVVGAVTPEGEGVKGDPEEKMQVADPEAAEPFVNVGLFEAKTESCLGEERSEKVSESASQDSSESLIKTENHTNQDWEKKLPGHTPEHSVHPEMEAEKKTAPPTSASLLVKIKDEPVDEEYEKALGPQAPAGNIKDEPDTSEEFGQKTSEQIKISAVFSVGGSSMELGSPVVAAAANAPSNTSVPVPSLKSATSLCVVCSGCKKILLKGQTAFQRKSSPQLYCSPRCLYSSTSAESVAMTSSKKSCYYCLKNIPNPKDVITAPVDSDKSVKDFCSQKCLSAFNYKRDSAFSALATKCSMCQKSCTIRHEVNFMGSVHKLCSDACFHQFRASNKLSMNSCITCGGYCYSGDDKGTTLLLDGSAKKFCSQNCLSTFKKKYTKVVPCTMCRVYRTITEMVESINSEGNTELFCSTACVTAHKVQTVSSSGSALKCNHCKKVLVPQYHLAMSDGTIRNFCCFTCVVSFQDAFNKTNTQSNQLNVAPPLSTTQLKSAPTVQPVSAESSSPSVTQNSSVTKFSCVQCQRSFFSKPELLEFKGKMYVFCDKTCIDEFRRTHYIMAQCVYCKIEKVVKEVKRINNVDCSFCSEGCKLLYKHDLAKRWGKRHCRNCLYCSSTSQTVMTSIFSGKQEEFCGNECLSQYTLLFCEVAKCSMCKRARKMTESVKWLNDMKHFCNLKCLMLFCSQQACTTISPGNASKPSLTQSSTVPISIAPVAHSTTTNKPTLPSLVPKEATPVIANVISLSSATNGQPNVLGSAALQGTVPTVVKLLGHASTQTDSVKTPTVPPRILKNKALLCKPMNQNKGTSCKPNTSNINTQTDETPPKVIVLPLPVPVFVPVPMHLFTQYTPHPVGLPFPVPVPMFLPTTLDSAERIVETIQKIKERIPDNPLEADLIMMADMVAEDSEKDKAVSQGDQDDNFIEDFDLEALSSHLSWEDDSISSTSRWVHNSESEKVPPSREAEQSPPSPPPQESQMDLEADFPVAESIEHLEHRTQEDKPVTTRAKTRKKNRDCFSHKKRARKRAEAPQSSAADVPHPTKVHTEYGIQAWKSWVRWRETQPTMEMPKFGSRNITIKEDLLQCTTAELSYGLCKFISEVRRPNGEKYKPDSIYYLCLGIQQYLFEKSRMENIFTDFFYTKFSQILSSLLKDWKPTILPSGYVHSRMEEEYLWECKQLGAFSPSVLLNTLLYFFTKFFNFKTIAQHRRLSFAHIMRCTRSQSNGSKMSCLRFYPPVHKENKNTSNEETDGVPAKRKKEEEEEEGVVLEMQENVENPLRCPVRLYEFYLSKCSGTVKQRTSVFYLRPERSCIPNSPLWFSHMSLDDSELESMLGRILTIREIHLETEKPLNVSESENQSDSE
ncbi:zinc finger MYM-type protein 4 isoform X1 [Hemibagrus wyckioides]|uniref:zinc finger MYM-type protein 4 isoform X1 n=1 Tax=Hemibagrus wyckioides TaxID=337641 RepID=UPI00266B9934|nr:zinc finger MYM-type protein 4 isoform X1 [Hemibagrus wyckioides]